MSGYSSNVDCQDSTFKKVAVSPLVPLFPSIVITAPGKMRAQLVRTASQGERGNIVTSKEFRFYALENTTEKNIKEPQSDLF